jgi:hypothetical protein
MATTNQINKGILLFIVWAGILTTELYALTQEKAQRPAAYIEGDRGWLDNGTAKIAVDKRYGGAIVYASPSQSNENMINLHDKGRQIQQSYYAGKSLDRKAEGQSPHWSPWAWNPVQAGNFEGDASIVLAFETADNGSAVCTRCRPRLWDMNEEPAQCYFSQRMEFEEGMNNVVCVTSTIECFRDKEDRWGPPTPLHQELPAVYAIRNLSRMVIYDANEPWTHDALTVVQYGKEDTWIWTRQKPTEPWAACVHPQTHIGLGVYSPEGRNSTWNMGWTGQEPAGTEYSAAPMHFAPLAEWTLDWSTRRSWRYWIIIGHLDDIRSRVYQLHERYPEG